ncbi:competence type IV pilus minor pilin ComGD [Planococcus donghaensis]|uniref:competence type IV pilus minor pilin ComGD n=1 Tax=Planococcus donghaensis TaxID=414778 RepID=UPI002351F198|nr:competence type IV pilus minor pilin ComGD [Planococcus donghaensis]
MLNLNEKGFTLLEMLLVLVVLVTISAISISGYRSFMVQKEEQRFFEILRQDIYFAQSQSYALNMTAKIIFRESKGTYEVFTDLQLVAVSRKLPQSIQLKKTSNLTEIYFNENGTVVQSGTLRFSTSRGEKTLVVHLGGGRVVFSE